MFLSVQRVYLSLPPSPPPLPEFNGIASLFFLFNRCGSWHLCCGFWLVRAATRNVDGRTLNSTHFLVIQSFRSFRFFHMTWCTCRCNTLKNTDPAKLQLKIPHSIQLLKSNCASIKMCTQMKKEIQISRLLKNSLYGMVNITCPVLSCWEQSHRSRTWPHRSFLVW